MELLAPECIVTSVTFQQKYIATVLLPLVLTGLILLGHFIVVCAKRIFGSRAAFNSDLPVLASFLLVLLTFLYMNVTQMLLQSFNCIPASPPDGQTYLVVNGEPCGTSGGTQMTLMPWSILGLVAYTLGYPIILAVHWCWNRELIMEDQLLRAKGVGDDKLSNPNAYSLRRSWARIYYHLKPGYSWFAPMLLLRKAAVAGAIVAFSQNAAFQLAAVEVVMLVALGINVWCRPFMSRDSFQQVLVDHARRAFTSSLHGRLAARLQHVQDRGRKRSQRSIVRASGKLDAGAAVDLLRYWASDYNTFDMCLIIAIILVCLLGMLSTVVSLTFVNSIYEAGGSAIYDLTLAILIVIVLYAAAVVVGEIIILSNEAADRKTIALRRNSSRKLQSGLNVKQPADSKWGPVSGTTSAPYQAKPSPASIDQSVNPLFITGSAGGGDIHNASLAAAAASNSSLRQLLSNPEPPSPDLWHSVREAYSTVLAAFDPHLSTATTISSQESQTLNPSWAGRGSAYSLPSKRRFEPMKALQIARESQQSVPALSSGSPILKRAQSLPKK